MKPKQIAIVLVAFVLLAIVYAVQKSRKIEVIDGLGYQKVMAGSLATADIYGFKYYLPGREEQAIHLSRKDGDWIVKSKFDAPAGEEKVNDFIHKLQVLEGQTRSSTEDVLTDYDIDDDNAIHLAMLGADNKEETHLLIGKQGPKWNETFVRLAGSNDVYLVVENLRRLLGISSEYMADPPSSTQWCDLAIMKIPEDKLSRIELEAPHRRLILELKKKEIPVSESEETSGKTETESGDPTGEQQEEWVMTEPKLASEPKEKGVKRLMRTFANLTASDVVDRGKLEEYGLKEPAATCSLTTREGETSQLLFGNPVPDGEGSYYVRVNDDDLIYKVDPWNMDAIFLKMSNLIDIDVPEISKDDVTTLVMENGDRSFKFEKKDGAWHMSQPSSNADLKTAQINKTVDIIANLKPQDLATIPSPEIIKLDKPAAVIRFSLKNGETHTLTFGGQVPLTAGDRFVRLDKRKDIWTITKEHWGALEPRADKFIKNGP